MKSRALTFAPIVLLLAGCPLVGPKEEKPKDDVADDTGGTSAAAPKPEPGAVGDGDGDSAAANTCAESLATCEADLKACTDAK